jgi:hypothetical protein
MPALQDGPASSRFSVLHFTGNCHADHLAEAGVSDAMASAVGYAPSGVCVGWGIPFEASEAIVIKDQPVSIEVEPTTARWLVFMHTADLHPPERNKDGFISPMRGNGRLGKVLATYVMCYADGGEERVPLRGRFQLGPFTRNWGENCFEAVPFQKPYTLQPMNTRQGLPWGVSQMRAILTDGSPWTSWLWAWENPHPELAVTGFRFEPGSSRVFLSAISAGDVSSFPLRWQARAKACLRLPPGEPFQPDLDARGLLKQVQLDLGQVITAAPRLIYPNDGWQDTYNNQNPRASQDEVLIEYTAHPDACFHLSDGRLVPVEQVVARQAGELVRPIAPATQTVRLRVIEGTSRRSVPVKLHVHGEWGEYLAPVDRPRILNPNFFEDYSPDFTHVDATTADRIHIGTYINGETVLKLPVGKVYFEVSRGFEVRPVRQVVEVMPASEEIVIEIEKVLPWREKGWVTADTHVHFLSPSTAMLEGSAEGVNVINLLASQWGELMTNVGDFDGRSTWGSREAGGDGEYLVRVGSENRQHVLGHISLLGYEGKLIAPMTTGGPDESALGDPVESLLIEWARQCKKQGGLVVLPHFPNPRAEHAASIVSGEVDALEMTSWEDHYLGIDPYSLSDWYRYLNCGYLVPVVGGTDKMTTSTAVGTVRTYARLEPDAEFTYETWKAAIRRAETFVSYGPLLDFSVAGRPMGSRLALPANGGTLDVTWQVASVTVPMTRVELVVNGEVRESAPTGAEAGRGSWSIKLDRSAWLALLVRGHYPDRPEIIAAHSSPVMVQVEGSPLLAAADAFTILDQIEGALAYLDTVGTRAEDQVYKRMRLALQSAGRSLHNRMHAQGYYHDHLFTRLLKTKVRPKE